MDRDVTAQELVRGVELGTNEAHKLTLPNPLANPAWGCESARGGQDVELSVGAADLPNSAEVKFTIWEHDADGGHDHIAEVIASVTDGRAVATWTYETVEDLDDTPTDLDKALGFPLPEFFFAASWRGFQVVCEKLLRYQDYLDISVLDGDGKPYANQDYSLRCGNLVKQGNTGSEGVIRVSDVPPGHVAVRFMSGLQLEFE
ncbi:hypothetical protein ACFL59_08170 [Planctomycetota bacterium]